MHNLFFRLILGLAISTQNIFAQPLVHNTTYKAIRVDHGVIILMTHGDNSYKVYAARCNEIINNSQKLDYIILNPGEPVELIDSSKNVLILYSLPCD